MKIILKVVVATIMSLSLCMSAQAIDYKTVAGTGCDAYIAGSANRVHHAFDGIYSPTAATWVSCAVPRDNIFNVTGTANLFVYVKAPVATITTTCYARSSDLDGRTLQIIKGTVLGSGWIKLNTTISTVNGTAFVYCLLAKDTKLSTIRVGESGNTSIQ